MNYMYLFAGILVMALVSYLPRVLPLVFFRKKIRNRFLLSLFTYMPYGILAAMVFPAVFSSTASVISACVGTLVALLMSYRKLPLLPVAVASVAAVFLTELLIRVI